MKFGAVSARNLAARYLREGDTVIDVGAADGFYTAIYAAQVKQAGGVFAIEPDLSNRLAFQQSLSMRWPKIVLLRCALSDEHGVARFFCGVNAKHSSFFVANIPSAATEIEVPIDTLDAVIGSRHIRPRLIQIDTQGAEAAILRGARRALKSKRTIWVIEIWPQGLVNAGASVADVIEPFKSRGYHPHDTRNRTLTWDAIDRLAKAQSPANHFNLVMVPAA